MNNLATLRSVDLGTLRSRLGRIPWLWSFLGALALWITIIIVAHRDPFGSLIADLEIGSFLVLVGLGQLCVICSGQGNIDLSIPNTMTLAALMALTVANGGHGSIALGIVVGLLVGLCVAACNIFSIFVLGIPAFVSTLAVGLIAQSVVLVRDADLNQVAPRSMQHFIVEKFVGIPVIVLITVGITLIVAVILHRTRFGRSVFAVGQSIGAADRSGLRTIATQAGCFVISSLLASFSGMAFATFSGPSIALGDPYLLVSVGTVVIGGSFMAGGRGNVTGIWTAALMLNLIVTLVYVLNLSPAWEDIFEGVVIITVLSLGASTVGLRTSGRRSLRRASTPDGDPTATMGAIDKMAETASS
jgi:ribose transport system permease protein